MNNRTAPTLFSILGAALVTIAMLAGVNGLATNHPTAAQVAHTAVAPAKA